MANFIVTYDIQKSNPDPHPIVRANAHNFGYYTIMHDYQNELKKLPNTTLNGKFPDFNAAQDKFYELIDFSRAKNGGVLVLEKYIIAEIGTHIFSSNEGP